MKQSPFLILPHQMEELAHSPPPRPRFGFLLGGTTLGIFFGCILLCAGAGPPALILTLLSILGAFTGGILEAFWPKPLPARDSSRPRKANKYNDISISPFRDDRKTAPARGGITRSNSHHECNRCGEVFEPSPIICPMCGNSEKSRSPKSS